MAETRLSTITPEVDTPAEARPRDIIDLMKRNAEAYKGKGRAPSRKPDRLPIKKPAKAYRNTYFTYLTGGFVIGGEAGAKPTTPALTAGVNDKERFPDGVYCEDVRSPTAWPSREIAEEVAAEFASPDGWNWYGGMCPRRMHYCTSGDDA